MELGDESSRYHPKPKLIEAFEARDDWAGLSDPRERRKTQNRLNQRARRKLLIALPVALDVASAPGCRHAVSHATQRSNASSAPYRVYRSVPSHYIGLIGLGRRENGNKWTPLSSKIDDVRRGHQKASNPSGFDALTMVKSNATSRDQHLKPRHSVLRVIEAIARGPTWPHVSSFPLSSDHLIPLIHYNVWRAIVTNMIILDLTQTFSCEGGPDHCLRVVPLPTPRAIPPSLEPTLLQRQVKHEPWIDLFPLPALRDTLIRADGTYDGSDLCRDMVGGIIEKSHFDDSKSNTPSSSCSTTTTSPSRSTSQTAPRPTSSPLNSTIDPDENKGLVIWGNPEYIGSWEVSEGFAKKWGWIIREGCGELLRATDCHRQARLDDPIRWESFGIKGS